MKYCVECLNPDTKPDLSFDEAGVCSACNSFKERSKIDWEARKQEFMETISHIRQTNKGDRYDCIIPVSGGKDSTYQVLKALEYGLHPLCVTATTCDVSDLGMRNLRNISKLGVDHIQITPNMEIRKKLNKYCLETVGDISWPEHASIFTVPVRQAIIHGVNLILWGENPQNEYGGPEEASGMKTLNTEWLQEFGGLNGLRIKDIIDQGLIESRDSVFYRHHPDTYHYNLKGLFLGYYFPWDGYENAKIAYQNGFEYYDGKVESCGFDYENLDNHQTGIHDYFKYIKFGFGRATDICNNHIRRGRMTREEAIKHVERWDGQFPWRYLGKPLERILHNIEMNLDEFDVIVNKFLNKELFDVDDDNNITPKFEVGVNA